jgi:hypothetical protein
MGILTTILRAPPSQLLGSRPSPILTISLGLGIGASAAIVIIHERDMPSGAVNPA